MPILKLKVSKSKEEQEEKNMVKKRIGHSNEIKVVAGNSQHATKSNCTVTKPL